MSLSTLSIIALLFISQLSASPVAKPDISQDSPVKSVVTIIKQLAEVVKNTGDVITKIARNNTDNPDIIGTGEFLSEQGGYAADTLPGEVKDVVQDNFQMVLQALPAIKGNITQILDQIPAFQQMIAEKVQSIPAKEEIKENIKSVFESLPEHDYVDAVEDHLGSQIDMLPSNDEIISSIDGALENIPEDGYFHSKIDELVDT